MVRHREAGFTFLELLLVLSIAMLVTLYATKIITEKSDDYKMYLFFRQLENDALRIQIEAMKEKISTRVVFTEGGTKYKGSGRNNSVLFVRDLPKGIVLTSASTMSTIGFTQNGSVIEFGTFVFSNGSKDYKVRVYIGKGRMKLER